MIVPSSAIETMNLGGLTGLAALQSNRIPADPKAAPTSS
jgi:hypothetical protein